MIKWIIALVVFVIGYVCSAIGFGKGSFLQVIIGAILSGLSTSLLIRAGVEIGGEQAIREYLSGEIEIDTVAVSPKNEVLKIELKYK